ncbi:MAG: terminase family protein [Acidobacteria bacterium]|nr:terminase family protein [Acidobacteriota bacterium]
MIELLPHIDPVLFARAFLGFEPDARQHELLRSDARRCVVNCTRQWGKSTVTAVKCLYHAFFHPESLTLVISPSARQSAEFIRKTGRFMKQLGMRIRGDGDNEISLMLPNGSRIVGLPSTEDRIRGFSSVSLMVIDEASRVDDRLYHAVRPMLAVGGRDGRGGDLWLMSTPNGKLGFFYEVWAKGGPEWTRVRVPATDCPRISREFLAEERRANSDRFFRQEYLCEFLDREDGAFRDDWIEDALRDDVPPLGHPETRVPGWTVDENSRRFFVGLDLGQRQDYTALAVIERHMLLSDAVDAGTRNRFEKMRYRCRCLRRLPLGTGYMEVVDKVKQLMHSQELAGRASLVVDASGVGSPVVEMLRKTANCALDPVTITSGQNVKMDHTGYKMPRRELMSQLALMLEKRELEISSHAGEIDHIRNELRNLRLNFNARGQENYDPDKESVHDDLVIAMALGFWKAKRSQPSIWGMQRIF